MKNLFVFVLFVIGFVFAPLALGSRGKIEERGGLGGLGGQSSLSGKAYSPRGKNVLLDGERQNHRVNVAERKPSAMVHRANRSAKNQHKDRHKDQHKDRHKDRHNIRMILALPLENRNQALSDYGWRGFEVLKRFVFSNKEKMPVRWKALLSMARLYPERALPVVQKALQSRLWFLKNAGLIAMEILNPDKSVKWAARFLDDPSLIVRTAAVDMIKRHKARQYKTRLLEKLNAPDSFYKNKSLWIRRHIVSALADFCEPGEEQMFISLLKDPDNRLHLSAVLALEKLTGKTFRSIDGGSAVASTDVKAQKKQWLKWWSQARQYRVDSVQL